MSTIPFTYEAALKEGRAIRRDGIIVEKIRKCFATRFPLAGFTDGVMRRWTQSGAWSEIPGNSHEFDLVSVPVDDEPGQVVAVNAAASLTEVLFNQFDIGRYTIGLCREENDFESVDKSAVEKVIATELAKQPDALAHLRSENERLILSCERAEASHRMAESENRQLRKALEELARAFPEIEHTGGISQADDWTSRERSWNSYVGSKARAALGGAS